MGRILTARRPANGKKDAGLFLHAVPGGVAISLTVIFGRNSRTIHPTNTDTGDHGAMGHGLLVGPALLRRALLAVGAIDRTLTGNVFAGRRRLDSGFGPID